MIFLSLCATVLMERSSDYRARKRERKLAKRETSETMVYDKPIYARDMALNAHRFNCIYVST